MASRRRRLHVFVVAYATQMLLSPRQSDCVYFVVMIVSRDASRAQADHSPSASGRLRFSARSFIRSFVPTAVRPAAVLSLIAAGFVSMSRSHSNYVKVTVGISKTPALLWLPRSMRQRLLLLRAGKRRYLRQAIAPELGARRDPKHIHEVDCTLDTRPHDATNSPCPIKACFPDAASALPRRCSPSS